MSTPPTSTTKTGRNHPCPCGSGHKYKYCCIGKQLRPQHIEATARIAGKPVRVKVDATNDLLNMLASAELPLKQFFADNDLYHFGLAMTVGEEQALSQQLAAHTLTREHVLAVYRAHCQEEPMMKLLAAACEELPIFAARRAVLTDAFEAHFAGKYTLSMPVLFAQLEGLLRDVGQLKNSDSVRGTINQDVWQDRLLRPLEDSTKFFNAFIQKLFKGSQGPDTSLNRNPILHGFRLDYPNADDSLLLLLTILEIRLFLWWERNTGHALANHPFLSPALPENE